MAIYFFLFLASGSIYRMNRIWANIYFQFLVASDLQKCLLGKF